MRKAGRLQRRSAAPTRGRRDWRRRFQVTRAIAAGAAKSAVRVLRDTASGALSDLAKGGDVAKLQERAAVAERCLCISMLASVREAHGLRRDRPHDLLKAEREEVGAGCAWAACFLDLRCMVANRVALSAQHGATPVDQRAWEPGHPSHPSVPESLVLEEEERRLASRLRSLVREGIPGAAWNLDQFPFSCRVCAPGPGTGSPLGGAWTCNCKRKTQELLPEFWCMSARDAATRNLLAGLAPRAAAWLFDGPLASTQAVDLAQLRKELVEAEAHRVRNELVSAHEKAVPAGARASIMISPAVRKAADRVARGLLSVAAARVETMERGVSVGSAPLRRERGDEEIRPAAQPGIVRLLRGESLADDRRSVYSQIMYNCEDRDGSQAQERKRSPFCSVAKDGALLGDTVRVLFVQAFVVPGAEDLGWLVPHRRAGRVPPLCSLCFCVLSELLPDSSPVVLSRVRVPHRLV